MSQVFQYTTKQGDYYDLISYTLFGTEIYSMAIALANPEYETVVAFESGIQLSIPIIPAATTPTLGQAWGTLH